MPWEKRFDVEQSLDKAMHIFWAHGYKATSMQDLVDNLSINRGSLYDTFGDKHSLFLAALNRYDKTLCEEKLGALRTGVSALEGIRKLFNDWVEALSNDSARAGCFLTNAAIELSAHDAEVGEIVARNQTQTEAFFREQVLRGQQAGEIPPSVDAARAAEALLASLLGLLVLGRSRPEPTLLGGIASSAMAIIER